MDTSPHRPYRIALISTSFHEDHMSVMNDAAKSYCAEHALSISTRLDVPGCMEVPVALSHVFASGKVAGAIVLGIIERGETEHGSVMGQAVIQSILDLQVQYGRPVGVGIIGPGVFPSQIEPRVEGYARAAAAALRRMLDLIGPLE